MPRRLSAVPLALAVLFATASNVHPQSLFFIVPGVRSQAMGNAGVADASDPNNVFLNPALAASLQGVHASIAQHAYPGNQSLTGVTTGGGLRFDLGEGATGVAGLQVRYSSLDYGTSYYGLSPRPKESYVGVTAGVGFRTGSGLGLDVGAGIKRWSGDHMFYNASNVNDISGDVGARLSSEDETAGGWRVLSALAASVSNVGAGIELTDGMVQQVISVEHTTRVGVSIRALAPPARLLGSDVPTVALTTDMELAFSGSESLFEAGFEVSALEMLSGRLGWELPHNGDISLLTFGVGWGIRTDRVGLRADYALTPLAVLGESLRYERTHRYGITVELF